MPHPGFPTDMQPSDGCVFPLHTEPHCFRNPFGTTAFSMPVGQLTRMGANIQVDGKLAVIDGADELSGVKVKQLICGAGAAMIIAGLCCSRRNCY